MRGGPGGLHECGQVLPHERALRQRLGCRGQVRSILMPSLQDAHASTLRL